MLNILTPLIIDGKLAEATIAMSKDNVNTPDDFILSYRNLTDKPISSYKVITKNTPYQVPYKQNLSVYEDLIGGSN